MNLFTRIFKVKSKATIYFDSHGEVISVVGNIGPTRAARGAFKLHCNAISPTVGYKLRRFVRRLAHKIKHRAEMASRFYDTESVQAIPAIGMLEDGR